MMQLHPDSKMLAELVFERMPVEGFHDASKILISAAGDNNVHGYDGLLKYSPGIREAWASIDILFIILFSIILEVQKKSF